MSYSLTIAKLNTHTDVGTIQAYLRASNDGLGEEIALSPALQAKLARIEVCKKLMVTEVKTAQIVAKLMQEFQISKRLAYLDIQECKEVFGDRQIWEELLFSNILESRKVAMGKMDAKALAINDKTLADAIAKFKGSTETDHWAEMAPPALVWANVPEPEMSREVLEAELERYMSARGKKVAEIVAEAAETIDFEELKDPEPQKTVEPKYTGL